MFFGWFFLFPRGLKPDFTSLSSSIRHVQPVVQVNHALTSMAAMFVVVGGVRWRERRQRVTLRRAGGGPSTAVVGSPQEPLSGCGVSGFGLSIQLRVIDET